MITLYSYPPLYGVADNNGYGLKVFAFLRLAELPFVHRYVFDASAAPRGQLPYIVEDGDALGDSEAIIAHLTTRHAVALDGDLTATQRAVGHLVTRLLDDLYWVMSYSRWKDDAFWPAFRDGFIAQHPALTVDGLEQARAFNAQRYRYQGIGRYAPADAYARGIADLRALATLMPADGFLHGPVPTSVDAGIYGFLANILFYPIETPLKAFLVDRPGLVRHCRAMHDRVAHGGNTKV